jgi:hypothetical protein
MKLCNAVPDVLENCNGSKFKPKIDKFTLINNRGRLSKVDDKCNPPAEASVRTFTILHDSTLET